MPPDEDTAAVGRMLDEYASGIPDPIFMMGVACEPGEDRGVPLDMQAGPVNRDGWVAWKVIPSTLSEAEVGALETEFGVQFPPLFKAYLLVRHHLFDQVKSRRYDQQIFMPAVPSRRRLGWLREEMRAWQPLVAAGYIPFAEWGDCWGPMCFDTERRGDDGDCPIVWMDHERLIPLGAERCRVRAELLPLVQPLYGSFREMLTDVFIWA